ncbi:MAG: polymer-forming cytoskeletal protein [Owenweeksia sp.]|nr:polymer-forming cytoskeletal protein [Owenweeksia sp.]
MMKKTREQTDSNQASNRVLAGTSIEGEIHSDGDIRIDGSLKGNINISGKLVIGEKGKVEGEVKCTNANVSGNLQGKIQVMELLSLAASAQVKGDVITDKLSVEPGAEFTGSCSMGSVIREMKNEQERATSGGGSSKQKSSKEASA